MKNDLREFIFIKIRIFIRVNWSGYGFSEKFDFELDSPGEFFYSCFIQGYIKKMIIDFVL